MKKLYTTVMMALTAMTASAQQDSLFVRIDFNENPWQLPVSIPNRDLPNGKGNWSVVDDETGCFEDTHTFTWPVAEGQDIQLVLTPSNWKLTDYMNAMVKTHDLNESDEPIITMLWMRRGSQLTFKAPEKYWFAKVVFDEYRNWASGSLYSGDATNNNHVWGKDSLQTRIWEATGEELPCWSGDSVEWSLPECTGNTFLRAIEVWLLPRETAVIPDGISEQTVNRNDSQLFDLQGRRLSALPRKGIYVVNGKKIVKHE